jgi:hypothetical protein
MGVKEGKSLFHTHTPHFFEMLRKMIKYETLRGALDKVNNKYE